MNCSSAEAFFDRFLADELDARRRNAVRTHVDRCPVCRAVLGELRNVDSVLGQPRQVELAADFTAATMAVTGALHPPSARRAPLRAYLVSYIAGAWLIAGAAVWIAPQFVHALVKTALGLGFDLAAAGVGVAAVTARVFARGGNALGALLGALVSLDAVLVAGFGLALYQLRPTVGERIRP